MIQFWFSRIQFRKYSECKNIWTNTIWHIREDFFDPVHLEEEMPIKLELKPRVFSIWYWFLVKCNIFDFL